MNSRKILLIITFVLCMLGLLFVFESSISNALAVFGDQYHFLRRQAIGLGIGFGSLIGALLIPRGFWRHTGPVWYLASVFLLLMVFIPGVGREFNGALRWISVFGLGVIQPIEIAKFGLVVGLSYWLSRHQRLAPFMLVAGLPILLVISQPDLTSSLLLAVLSVSMFFLAGGRVKWLAVVTGSLLLFAVLAIATSEYRTQRVLTFVDPSRDPLGSSFHIRQITLALGRGGWVGQGIGNSRQKDSYIPEPSTDSIFAIVGEEIGFLGSLLVISLYGGYTATGWRIARKQVKDRFSFLLASGIVIWITLQTLINLAAVVALIPLTGMPLPFFSYGSSSLVMVLFATGVLAKLDRK